MPPAETVGSASDGPGVRLVAVDKTFGAREVLRNVSFEALPGQITAVEGRNGAGKTTLVRLMATIVLPDRGLVEVGGLDVVKRPNEVRRIVGLALVNERSLQWRLDVQRNLELWAAVRGFGRRSAAQLIDVVLQEVGLEPQRRQRVAELSSGQRHRLVLARALLASPPVLLVDEPLRGLDEDATGLVLNALQTRAQNGATVVAAAPRLDELETLAAARWVVTDEGELSREPDGNA